MRVDRDNLNRTTHALDDTLARGCAVCESLEASGKDYFCHAFAPRHLAALCESLVDAAGFCQRHARMLAIREELAETVAQAFISVIAKFEELLRHENFYAERLQQIAFAANDSCPACGFEHRCSAVLLDRLARSAASAFQCMPAWPAVTLCSPHFQQVVRGLKFDLLQQCVELQIETVTHLKPVLVDAQRDPPATTDPRAFQGEALRGALRILRGASPAQPSVPADRHGDEDGAVSNRDDRYRTLGHATKCPVCVEMGRALVRAMDGLPRALKFGRELWLVFPDCAEHVWACMRQRDPLIAAVAVRHAFDNTVGHLKKVRESLLQLAQWEQEAATALQEGTDRPRRMRVPSPGQILSRPPRCPVCERVAIAHDGALERVLAAAQSRQGRDVLQSGYGLCCKHFADACALTLKSEVRSYLATIQLDRLGRLKSGLERELFQAPTTENRTRTYPGLWREALRRFSGEW